MFNICFFLDCRWYHLVFFSIADDITCYFFYISNILLLLHIVRPLQNCLESCVWLIMLVFYSSSRRAFIMSARLASSSRPPEKCRSTISSLRHPSRIEDIIKADNVGRHWFVEFFVLSSGFDAALINNNRFRYKYRSTFRLNTIRSIEFQLSETVTSVTRHHV